MKGLCIFLAVILMCLLLPVRAWAVACPVAVGGAAPADTAQTAARDSARRDSLRADTLREVVVRPDSVLPVVRVLEKTVGRSRGPRSMSLGDVIEKVAPGLQDKMLHPFAIKQRDGISYLLGTVYDARGADDTLRTVEIGRMRNVTTRLLDGKKLFAAAAGILNDPQRMETMSQNMAALGIPDATKRIYDTVMTLLK